MPEFTPIKHKDFNDGNQFVRGDILSPNEMNKIIETILYVLKNIDGRIVDKNTITIGNVDDFTASLIDIMASGQVHLWADGYVDIEGDQVTINGVNSDSKITISNTGGISITTEKGQKLALNGNDFAEIVKALQKNISDLQTATKRIVNLEESLSDDMFITNSEVAYERAVPAPVAPYAAVDKIGGMSYVVNTSKNVLDPTATISYDINYNDHEVEGGVYFDENGVLIYSGAPKKPFVFFDVRIPVTLKGKHTIQIFRQTGEYFVDPAKYEIRPIVLNAYGYIDDYAGDWYGKPITFTGDGTPTNIALNFYFANPDQSVYDEQYRFEGGEYDWWEPINLGFKIMINEGETALPWESPNKTELLHAPVTKLESIGKNLLDISKGLNACLVDNGDGTYTLKKTDADRFSNKIPIFIPANTEARIYGKILSYSNSTYNFAQLQFFKANGNRDYTMPMRAQSLKILSTDSDIVSVMFYMDSNTAVGDYVTFSEPQIELGTMSTDYAPFSAEPIDTFKIPEAVQALEGYGEGVSADCNNHIEYQDERVIYKRDLETVVLTGDETKWAEWGSDDTFAAYWTDISDNIFSDRADGISNKYQKITSGAVGFGISNGTTKLYFKVPKSKYPTVDAWRNQLRAWNSTGDPLIVIAQAKYPEVTDITDLMPADNFLKVQSNGRIRAVNEHALAVPTTITYQKEG